MMPIDRLRIFAGLRDRRRKTVSIEV